MTDNLQNLPDLKKYVEYWDEFVSDWINKKDYVNVLHLPEPWWGTVPTTEKNDLMSVVMNISPGEGSLVQERHIIKAAFKDLNYSEAMLNNILPRLLTQTNRWHNILRAKPVVSLLLGTTEKDYNYLAHHLSIELSPFHKLVDTKNNEHETVRVEDMINYSLKFAADASRHIHGPLNNTVLVRYSPSAFQEIFSETNLRVETKETDDPKVVWLTIEGDPVLEGIDFICLNDNYNRLRIDSLKKIIELKTNQNPNNKNL